MQKKDKRVIGSSLLVCCRNTGLRWNGAQQARLPEEASYFMAMDRPGLGFWGVKGARNIMQLLREKKGLFEVLFAEDELRG